MILHERNRLPGWLFVLPWPLDAIGGVARVLSDLVLEYDRSDLYKTYVLVLDWEAKKPIYLNHETYIEIRLRVRSPGRSIFAFKENIAFLLTIPKTLLILHKIVKKYDIKVINPHYLGAEYINFALFRFIFRWCKYFLSFHGTDLLDFEKSTGFLRSQLSYCVSKADYLICCSNGFADRLKNMHIINKERVVAIPNGIAHNFSDVISNLPEELVSSKYILSIGTFDSNKGQNSLIRAFSNVIDSKKNIKLVLVGRDGSSLASVYKLVEQLGLCEYVFIYKNIPLDEIGAFYKNAILYVSASRFESFGLVLLEAALFKLAIVATKTIGSLELIEHEKDGLLVEIDSKDELVAAISYLIDNDKVRINYSEIFHHKVLNTYTWENSVLQYTNLLRDLN